MQTIKAALSRFFGSRKMTLGIVGMGVIVISNLAPELSPRAEQIGNLIFAVVGIVSGTIMLEDSMKAWANRPRTLAEGWAMAKDELTGTSAAPPTSPVGYKLVPGLPKAEDMGSMTLPAQPGDTLVLPKLDPVAEGADG